MNYLLNPSRVAFSIGTLDIYWYGIIIASAMLIDFILLILLCKKLKKNSDMPFDLIIAAVPAGIIFARLFAVLFDADLSIADYFDFRGGGMSIIGAVIGGALGIGLYCIIKKKNFFEVADVVVPLIILAQGIGRWGNYFNQEVYGQKITNVADQWFPQAVYIDAERGYFQALFFYESVLDLIGFAFLLTLLFSMKKKHGYVLSSYLMFYGAVRYFLEGFRQSEYILKIGSLPISKIVSGIMFVSGFSILVYLIIKSILDKKKENATNKSEQTTRL